MMLTNPTDFINQVSQGWEITYKFTPMGVSELIENYTGQEISWKPGDVARFKEKGREFETAVPGANTIGKANTIDLEKYPEKAYLVGKPLSADPTYNGPDWDQEGGGLSNVANPLNGMNSMSVIHDKFAQEKLREAPELLQLSIIPIIPVSYYGLIGKEIRNFYSNTINTKQAQQ